MTDQTTPLGLDQQLCFALYAASNAMTRLYRDLLEPLGLTYPQYLAMLVLWEQAPLNVKTLGERLQLDSGTLTPMLKRMEQAGLVTRRRDPADERQLQVALTPAGAAMRPAVARMQAELACRLPLPLREAARLRGELQGLAAGLNAGQQARAAE
ncbi:MarR family winged helix-turn-helix transcriptional regulator [Ferrovibrio sp.]|uniref:MarR family winged helix-turn-helix transcriptional regulator n=2 Tax=Ferrovibrio sp. TaxID=1917215 RepID=UPI0035187ED3